jgi:urease accessory protein UreE
VHRATTKPTFKQACEHVSTFRATAAFDRRAAAYHLLNTHKSFLFDKSWMAFRPNPVAFWLNEAGVMFSSVKHDISGIDFTFQQ